MDIDIDNDLDGRLLDLFRSMGTTDHDVLISQFQTVLGDNKLKPEMCAFFLEMNNWNLQNAICSYCDLEQQQHQQRQSVSWQDSVGPSPVATVLAQSSSGGTTDAVVTNFNFVRSWQIKNTGATGWPPGCNVQFSSGCNMMVEDRKMVPPLNVGQEAEVQLELRSPPNPGSYTCFFKLCTPTGSSFNDDIKLELVVMDEALWTLTNQMSQIGRELNCEQAAATSIAGSGGLPSEVHPPALHSQGTQCSDSLQSQQNNHCCMLPQTFATEQDDDMS